MCLFKILASKKGWQQKTSLSYVNNRMSDSFFVRSILWRRVPFAAYQITLLSNMYRTNIITN